MCIIEFTSLNVVRVLKGQFAALRHFLAYCETWSQLLHGMVIRCDEELCIMCWKGGAAGRMVLWPTLGLQLYLSLLLLECGV